MAFWSVASTENQRETIAAFFLAQSGFQTYLPRLRVNRGRKSRVVPLFPMYIFVRVVAQWHIIESTIGVVNLVKTAGGPARLSDEIVEQIRSREVDGLIKLPTPGKRFKRGDRVSIARGSFRGHVALYDGMSARDRVFVLLELLGRQTRVELKFGDIAPAVRVVAEDPGRI